MITALLEKPQDLDQIAILRGCLQYFLCFLYQLFPCLLFVGFHSFIKVIFPRPMLLGFLVPSCVRGSKTHRRTPFSSNLVDTISPIHFSLASSAFDVFVFILFNFDLWAREYFAFCQLVYYSFGACVPVLCWDLDVAFHHGIDRFISYCQGDC